MSASDVETRSQVPRYIIDVVEKFSGDIGVPIDSIDYQSNVRQCARYENNAFHEGAAAYLNEWPITECSARVRLSFVRNARHVQPYWSVCAFDRENGLNKYEVEVTNEITHEHVVAVKQVIANVRANAKAAQS